MTREQQAGTPVEDPLDELVRRVRLVEPGQSRLRADDAWFEALLGRVVADAPDAAAEPAQPTGPRWGRHAPRSVVVAAVALGAVGLGAGAAVSVTQFLQPDRLTVACVLGTGAEAEQVQKRATVADPLSACSREWGNSDVPPLAVFMDPFGSVFVAPEAWEGVPGLEVTRVAQDVAFDPRPARLQAALDDWIDGLPADCLTNEEAIGRVQQDLARLNLLGWTVRSDDNGGREEPADGVRTCASAIMLEDGEREVVVRNFSHDVSGQVVRGMDEAEKRAFYTEQYRDAVESGGGFEDPEREWVEDSIASDASVAEDLEAMRVAFGPGRCVDVEQAEQVVDGLLDPSWNPVVDVSVDDTLPCAVVEAGMGGTWLISIVGPAEVAGD